MSKDDIVKALEALNYEIAAESRLIRAGLKHQQTTAGIMLRYPLITSRETIDYLRRGLEDCHGQTEEQHWHRLYFSCVDSYIRRKLAILDDALNYVLANSRVEIDGEVIHYYSVVPWLQRQNDFAKREMLGEKMKPVLGTTNTLIRHIWERSLDTIRRDFGYQDYIDFCKAKKGFRYESILPELLKFLDRTQDLYEKHISVWSVEKIGRPFNTISRYHAIHMVRISEFDSYFPREKMIHSILRTFHHMGLDPQQISNIHMDLAVRKRKNPQAVCIGLRIPQEVHLIVKPAGGLIDYEILLHELGHAMHLAHCDPALPYEFRHLPSSYALSEAYAFLIESVICHIPWLQRQMGIPFEIAKRLRYYRLLKRLCLYRRYIGKFMAELEFFKNGNLGDGSVYARCLRKCTGFIYDALTYLADLEPDFYSIDYLRAWTASAQLNHYLETHFGEDWPFKKGSGDFLVDLWRTGETCTLEAVMESLGYSAGDIYYIEDRFEQLEKLI